MLGVYLEEERLLVQLVGPDFLRADVEALCPLGRRVYTFNGHAYDLPKIKRLIGVDIRARCDCVDLMLACRKAGFRGGLKAIEEKLLHRSGRDEGKRRPPHCGNLWRGYEAGDEEALTRLLAYNGDDCTNMVALRNAMLCHGTVAARFG